MIMIRVHILLEHHLIKTPPLKYSHTLGCAEQNRLDATLK